MGNKCLVTNLKSAIDNDSLKYFDAIMFTSTDTLGSVSILNTSYGIVFGGVGVTYKILTDNAEFVVNNSSVGREYIITGGENSVKMQRTVSDNIPIKLLVMGLNKITRFAQSQNSLFSDYFDTLKYIAPNLEPYNGGLTLVKAAKGSGIIGNGDWIAKIINKKDFTNIIAANYSEAENLDVDLSSFKGFVNVTSIPSSGMNYMGDISGLGNMAKLKRLPFGGKTAIYGDVSSINGCISMETVELNSCPDITGDVVNFGGMTGLKTLRVNGSEIYGKIEDLVSELMLSRSALGLSREGSFQLYANNNVTFNGVVIGEGQKVVSWTSSGVITLS